MTAPVPVKHFALLGVTEPGQAEVEHLHHPPRREHQVVRLDVSVDEAVFVGVVQPDRRLPDHLARVRYGQLTLIADELRKVETVDQLHREVVVAARVPGVRRPHDVRVIEAADDFHLPLEPGHHVRVDQPPVGQQLQGHAPLEAEVLRLVDDAHAAFSDLLNELVLPDLGSTAGACGLADSKSESPETRESFR